ncbi:CAP domain-containing protein [Nocardioides antri]|uniref:CAP domain-containing protein n=1 Tax=Nocardioides antri TaxID=2607659 RepID=A0A5B1M568_9ACTN|nr:CAP domain-containing protein [Nocardioides antri]KAA1427931.1 CAP domain-containing protein [Nocardioides antri]
MRMTMGLLTALLLGLLLAPSSTAAPVPTDRLTVGVDQTERAAAATRKEKVVILTNKRRVAHGCRKVRSVRVLNRVAQKHTRLMASWDDDGQLDHQLPGEAPLATRLDNAGYRWLKYGENILNNVGTPRGAVVAWMNSPSHKANIVDCAFRHIGVGYALAEDGTPYWTQVFGKR